MFLYTILAAIAGILGGLLLATRTKKSETVTYGKLDKAGRLINIVLIFVYAILSPFYLFLGMISGPGCEGFLWVVGGVVSIIIASAALICGLGLGFSVALRKRGKSKLSFAVQFAGLVSIGISFLLFFIFYGNLLSSLN